MSTQQRFNLATAILIIFASMIPAQAAGDCGADYPVNLPCHSGGTPIVATAPQSAAVEYASKGPATLAAQVSSAIRKGGWEVVNFSSSPSWSFDAVRGAREVRVTLEPNGSNAVALFQEVGAPPSAQELAQVVETPAPLTLEQVLLGAAKEQDQKTVEAVLRQGANPDVLDENGATPLFFAVFNNNPALAQLLLDAGADPNLKGRSGTNYLAQAMYGFPPRPEVAITLIANGANISAPGVMGGQPLAAAAYAGELKIVEALLARGADVTAKNELGVTALHSAASSGDLKIISLLIQHGADVNARTNAGLTVLHVGTDLLDLPEVASLLLQSGADPSVRSVNGKTAFQRAVELQRDGYAAAIQLNSQ